ncbi:MAG: hypothetical protein H7Z14_00970 [Anaerolineae bacterium]|nr:hypothetical protein [Phycisphaerae bacterium]
MPRVAPVVPAESDLLCEKCGYTLNGLPESGNCPECGEQIVASTHEDGRSLSPYEVAPSARSYWKTSIAILLHPKRFYRSVFSRHQTHEALRFSLINLRIAALLFALAAVGHAIFILNTRWSYVTWKHVPAWVLLTAVFALGAYLLLKSIQRLAAWLSAIEAKYWGMRLPLATVRRAMQFHSINYVIVATATVAVVWAFRFLLVLGWNLSYWATSYLYTLSALVVIGAVFLFQMYWIAMRNMMYANR